MRSLPDRARLEGARALQKVLEAVRGRVAHRAAGDLRLVHDARAPDARAHDARAHDGRAHDERAPARPAEHDVFVARALERIAETVDRLATQLDSHHRERAEQLEAIQFLLQEMVIGAAESSAARPIVLGGVVDPEAIDPTEHEITVIADGYPLEVDTPVEVRSRFHDRWICGFAIAEAVSAGPGPCRYRLTRRSDGIPLPILFDACDVRSASSFERLHATD